MINFSTFAYLLVVPLVLLVSNRYIHEKRIHSLGWRAPQISTLLPLGLDLVYTWFNSRISCKELEFIKNKFAEYGRKSPVPRCEDDHGWTVESTTLGRRTIFTADPENVKCILLNNSNAFVKGKGFHRRWKRFLGNSVFATSGPSWHEHRRALRPHYSRSRFSSEETFRKLELHVNKVVQRLGEKKSDADIQDIFTRLSMDVATDFFLDNGLDTLDDCSSEFREAFVNVWEDQRAIAVVGPDIYPQKRFKANMKIINAYFRTSIESKIGVKSPQEPNTTPTFLEELIHAGHGKDFIRDEMCKAFFATQLVGLTLSWLFFELSTKPEIVSKLRSEILENLGCQNPPTYEDLKNRLPYLNHNLQEILRLYPPTWLIFREATRDTSLPVGAGADGSLPVGVPKGTLLMTSSFVLQRRKDLYPSTSESFADPDMFSPDRWQSWRPRAWHYLPFNGGQRTCVGQQFSLLMMGYTVCRVLQRVARLELSERSQTPMPQTGVSLEMKGEVLVRFLNAENVKKEPPLCDRSELLE